MKLEYLKDVSTIEITNDACVGCSMCIIVCPHEVLEITGKKVKIKKRDACMECGACVKNCPVGVLKVKPGVGCAYAIIKGMITGGPPDCGC